MFKSDNIRELWKDTDPMVWEGNYWLASFALQEHDLVAEIISEALIDDSYHSVIRDQHEIALILHETIWDKYRVQKSHQNEFGPLKGITFNVVVDIEVSGYLAPMVEKMAEHNISIVPQCALIYDHVFIDTEDTSAVLSIIENIKYQAANI
ncbi:MAG: hypothetical protein ACRBHB_17710 [Arenicella sp.]